MLNRSRKLAVMAIVVPLALLSAVPAQAASRGPQPTGSVYSRTRGELARTTAQIGTAVVGDTGVVPVGQALAASGQGPVSGMTPSVVSPYVGTAISSGCWTLTITYTKYDSTWPVHVLDWQMKSWVAYCWSQYSAQVFSSDWSQNNPPNGIYAANVAGCCYQYAGLVAGGHAEFYYGPWYHAGFQTMNQAVFNNCIFRYGCIGANYPRIAVQLWDDGEYFYQTSGA